jgi:hypothetical protein
MNNQRRFQVVCVRFFEGKKKAIWPEYLLFSAVAVEH